MLELTERNLVRFRFVGIFAIGVFIGIALGELRFVGAWVFWLVVRDGMAKGKESVFGS